MSIEERIEDACHLVVVGLIAAAFLPWEEAPPWNYWTTLGHIAWLGGAILAVVFGVLHIGMKGLPRLGRFSLMMAVVAVLFLGAWDKADQAWKNEKSSKEAGEDSYAYFQVKNPVKYLRRQQNPAGYFTQLKIIRVSPAGYFMQLKIIGVSKDVAIGWYKKDKNGVYVDMKTWRGKRETLLSDTIDQRRLFGITDGEYQISFRSPNGWEQYLTLSSGHNVLEQVIDIKRKGKSILSEPLRNFYPLPWKLHGTR